MTVVDAADFESRKLSSEIARAQIVAADVVVLSKVDRAADTSSTEAEVRELNAGVTCMRAQFGDVDPAALLQVTPGKTRWADLEPGP